MVGVCLLALPAQANLLTNGNFSQCTKSTGGSTCPATNFAVGTSSSGAFYTLTGWTLASPNNLKCVVVSPYTNDFLCGSGWTGGSANLKMFALPGASPDGGNYFISDGDSLYSGSLSQTIAVVANTTYKLTFYQAAGQQQANTGAGVDYWKVTFTGAISATKTSQNIINVPSQSLVTPVWQQVVYTFTAATTGNTTLSFLAVGNSGIPPFLFLDGVDLSVATPEPGSSALVLLGLVGLPLARKYLRKRA